MPLQESDAHISPEGTPQHPHLTPQKEVWERRDTAVLSEPHVHGGAHSKHQSCGNFGIAFMY
jgi:hypothetical protein